ncbi:unnamed protein product [Cylindrotheca closterium]|uniref:Uncharacterized protein n=1 Tax=Cylindrotheca closterium TaxID=2856 RepID=A0AAD2CWC2_9STRA|nr:unnamed protein product [Cylindrotheca closterium]
MRNILDKVYRELSVTKTLMAEREELRRDQEDFESRASAIQHEYSLRGHDSSHVDNDNNNNNKINNQEHLRGSEQRQHHRKMLADDDGPPEGPISFNRESAMFEAVSDMDQAFPILDNATISTDNTTATTSVGNGMSSQLDVGAWLLMVLVVGFAVFGVVTYRSSPRGRRRRGSNDFHYRSVTLPVVAEDDDWGSA